MPAIALKPEKKSVDDWLNEVNYSYNPDYVPSDFAFHFINFVKMVNGAEGEENSSPIMHYRMLDQIPYKRHDVANMAARGSAKTSVLGEYLILYIAVYGEIPVFGKVIHAVYISDSIGNGVKKMRRRLERRWQMSEFLQTMVPFTRFTDERWEFRNTDGDEFVVGGYGAQTGFRGTVELNTRPRLAILDDLVSDADAKSATVIENIEDVVYKAVEQGLHPVHRKIIWSGTPFNAGDPLYKAIESGAWFVNVFPICEEFPCSKEEFRGAWEDRFTYEAVQAAYDKAVMSGKLSSFNQELMLRIMSEEERVITDADITWYKRASVLENKHNFNFYITTDFATSDTQHSDFSVIFVWAYASNGDWFWVDGICKRQLMGQNIDDLFRLAQMYMPMSVGVEISGQQKGFISWIQDEMITRNIYFNLAKDVGSNQLGIRPYSNKHQRFSLVTPLFKLNKIKFPIERKESPELVEIVTELSLVCLERFKSKHDDAIDGISMLINMPATKPAKGGVDLKYNKHEDIWEAEDVEEETSGLDLYLV